LRVRGERAHRYDILDDELNRWLGHLADRLGASGELVVVTDARHSASNTRGPSALVSRAAPADGQESHPDARGPSVRHPLAGAILIGAAGDEQSAYEYNPKDDTPSDDYSGPHVQDSFPPNLSCRADVHRSGLALPPRKKSVAVAPQAFSASPGGRAAQCGQRVNECGQGRQRARRSPRNRTCLAPSGRSSARYLPGAQTKRA
jgi:hypothetical protein